MKMNYKKNLRFVVLLVTALFIATASASVYTTIYMKASPITISASEVKFTTGGDTSTAGGTINSAGTEVVFASMSVAPNATRTYSQAVNITNSGSGSHYLTLLTDSVTGNLTSFKFIDITVYDQTGVKQGVSIRISPTLSNVTSTTQLTISASKVWSVEWVISSIDSGAQEGTTVAVTLKMNVE